ncbi:MAG: diphthamide synthesis protein [Candidatus Parvarchaeota archaeon]|nr:diphthamide synthesis protein [Candidatus Jingweiarchaeum tengchongense]MCW1297840.1 diphthamide synthesis protein [Candidatus Jingweiarchaeum tengchongense]MCW1299851.1 diphthamide synthesis protein [Candidatus Jingweiarchaeum tengchongense]MCW1304179.1 diphthamide synthesis protein [Candidatus Jingweiarchaeum tengchongense]MCW1305207.1 diphthamide synthesis protein [Candidatus Jingweiarchaeum tengchongense]
MEYDIELKKIKNEIKKAKRILIQLPEGIRNNACKIACEIEKERKIVFIWAGSCFGACDIPNIPKKFGIDLLIHFGHSKLRGGSLVLKKKETICGIDEAGRKLNNV